MEHKNLFLIYMALIIGALFGIVVTCIIINLAPAPIKIEKVPTRNSVVIEDGMISDCLDQDGTFIAYQFMEDNPYVSCRLPAKTVTY